MARGRLLKTKRQDWYWQSKMETKGRLQALREFHKTKTIEESLREHLGKFLDRLTMDDFLTLGSIVSLAIVLKPIIQGISEIKDAYQDSAPVKAALRTFVAIGAPIVLPLIPFFAYSETAPDKIEIRDELAWLMSFTIAVLTVKFGPDLLKQTGGVKNLVSLLLGVTL